MRGITTTWSHVRDALARAFATAATLAIAQEQRCDGLRFAEAWLVATEIALRLAGAVDGELGLHSNGFHTTSIFGTFGAAAGAAKLLGLSTEQTGDRPRTCSELHQRRGGGVGGCLGPQQDSSGRASPHRPVVAGGAPGRRGLSVCSGHDRRSPWPLPLTRLGQDLVARGDRR